ncbi:hypothetical protein [Pedococcus bigeumensis]|uniref:hypothetical protein n=1 Tax=Pedococcus bigeumensis TaxID=433644 RepID=UPI0031CDEC9B
MNAVTRVAAFGAGIAVAFVAAFGTGRLIGPLESVAAPAPHTDMPATGHTPAQDTGTGGHGDEGHADEGHGAETATPVPAGLSATDQGYRLVAGSGTLTPSTSARVTFRILGPDGRAVTGFTTAHEKKLHLIVVRRDLSGFQHVHPVMSADGTWAVGLDLSRPGQWRMFADFDPDGPTGGLVLGTDLAVPGDYSPVALPGADASTSVDGFSLRVAGALSPARAQPVAFTIGRSTGTRPVSLEPYLGAGGHLVVLREGDLAYAHAHPLTGVSSLAGGAAGLAFQVEAPGPGRYRLFLDFKAEGVVHTAAFTLDAGTTP